jgi:PTS system glucitol/sorbitol-specific IIA component
MSASAQPTYDLEATAIGAMVGEFTSHGIWVFFGEGAPEEVAEFAILHRAAPPTMPVAPGQTVEIDGRRYAILAVGEVANANLASLGHLVLKANGETTPELPGDVCIEARPLPDPFVGMRLRIWNQESKDLS